MMNTYINTPTPVALLSDYDLDGAGSSILIKRAYNVEISKHQGLAKFQRNLEKIYQERPDIKILIVADICVPVESLKWAIQHYDHVIYHDHHLASENYIDLANLIPEKLTVYWRDDICSCALVYKSLIDHDISNRHEFLDNLVRAVNAFDMWHSDHFYFHTGVMLNDIFWASHMQLFLNRFSDGLDQFTELEISNSHFLSASREQTIANALVEELSSGSKIVMVGNPNAINFVPLQLSGDIFYIMYHNEGTGKIHMSVRTKTKMPSINLDMAMQELCAAGAYEDLIVSGGGHANAIGIRFTPDTTANAMAEFARDVLDIRVRNF